MDRPPRTATLHTVNSCRWPLGVNNAPLLVIGIPILAPLRDVAVHVKQTKRIGWEITNRRASLPIYVFLAVVINVKAKNVCLVGENRFAKMEGRCCTGTTGVFPLGFGG